MADKSQHSNVLLAFFTLVAAIVIVSVIGFFTLGKGPEIIQGQAEATEYRVSSKVPGRILKYFVTEGDQVKAGDTLAILEAPDVMAKLLQAQAAEQAALAMNQKANKGTRSEQLQAAFEMWQKAKAGLEIAEKSYKRVNNLFEQGVVSEQKRDEAKAQYEAMKATEKAANAQYTMAKNGAQAIIVIGGKHSANTVKLALLVKRTGLACFHIETINELDMDAISKFQVVGVTAGASTPAFLIDEVCNKLESL